MEKIKLSQIDCPEDLEKYDKNTKFVWDNNEKPMKVPAAHDGNIAKK